MQIKNIKKLFWLILFNIIFFANVTPVKAAGSCCCLSQDNYLKIFEGIYHQSMTSVWTITDQTDCTKISGGFANGSIYKICEYTTDETKCAGIAAQFLPKLIPACKCLNSDVNQAIFSPLVNSYYSASGGTKELFKSSLAFHTEPVASQADCDKLNTGNNKKCTFCNSPDTCPIITPNTPDPKTPEPKFGVSLLGITASLKISKPTVSINIPDLKFSTLASSTATDENGVTYLHIPYIGEYLSAIYKFFMVVISIIGVIMIVVEGMKITVMGGEERVNGFKRIGQIAIGLFIAWGSYAILYNINPDLVTFQALKVQYVKQEPLPPDDIADDSGGSAVGGSGVLASEFAACDNLNTANPPAGWVNFDTECGAKKCPGVQNYKRGGKADFIRKEMSDILKKAGLIAAKTPGNYISVRSKCRTLDAQKAVAKSNPNGASNGTVATPGHSPHGTGYAVDIVLMNGKNNISDGSFSGETQCNANKAGVALLSTIMYQAGAVRFGYENWHFESRKVNSVCRIVDYTGISPCIPPAKGPDKCPVK